MKLYVLRTVVVGEKGVMNARDSIQTMMNDLKRLLSILDKLFDSKALQAAVSIGAGVAGVTVTVGLGIIAAVGAEISAGRASKLADRFAVRRRLRPRPCA